MPSLLWSHVSAQIPHVDLRRQDLKLVISILDGSSLALHLTSDLRVQRAFEAGFSGAREVFVLGWGSLQHPGAFNHAVPLVGALRAAFPELQPLPSCLDPRETMIPSECLDRPH